MLWIALICSFVSVIHCYCDPPPMPPNGMLTSEFSNHEAYPMGSKVQFMCKPGYVRIPGVGNTLYCSENSRWVPVLSEFCRKRLCVTPSEIENGYFEASDFYFGSKLTYYCNVGYRMVAENNVRECLADGFWSNNVPECKAVTCPTPDSILYGTYKPLKAEYTYLDSVKYSCGDPNRFLNSEDYLYCRANGTWSSSPPKCIAVDCPNPYVPFSSKLSGFIGPYTLNSIVTFECYKGYAMSGHSSVGCNINSNWEPPLPKCIRGFCTEPSLHNGYISKGSPTDFVIGMVKGYNIGETVELKCNKWFILKGSRAVTCGSDLKWSPAVPICEKTFGCSYPNIENGRVILKNGKDYVAEIDGYEFSNDDKVQIICDPGFIMLGSESSECDYKWLRARYIWTPELPRCIPEKD